MSVDGGLRSVFRGNLRGMHWTTIETPGTETGVPDSNACADGVELWIEYKFTRKMGITLRPAQIGWLLTRERHGGRTFVAVRRVASTVTLGAVDELYLYRGSLAATLRDQGLRVPPLGCWRGGPAGWDWAAVRALLLAS